MQVVDKGLVLRETPYKDSDVILTILTECCGKISVLARGARQKSSRFTAAIQLLTYSEFSLYESRGRYTLNEAESLEMFYGIRRDIKKLALASYFAEVLEQAADEESINPELLRLGLNSVYALANTSCEEKKLKAVFEIKVASLSGYCPNVFSCASCGKTDDICEFDIRNGAVYCKSCAHGSHRQIDASVADAMRYIIASDIKKIFSFSIGESSLDKLSKAAEEYLTVHFDRTFKTNSFYKSIV